MNLILPAGPRSRAASSSARSARRTRWAIAAAVAAAMPAAVGRAAPITWDGDGPDPAFSTGDNWVGGVPPQNSATVDTAVFTGTPTPVQPVLTTSQSVLGIDFQSAGWTLQLPPLPAVPPGSPPPPPPPPTTLTLGAGGISSAGAGTNTISTNVTQSVAATWTMGAGNTFVLNSEKATLTAQPTITGAGNFVKAGAGTLSLSNAGNDYTGTTTVRQGTLNANAVVAEGATGPLGNAATAVVLGDAGTPVGNGNTANVVLQVNAAAGTSFARDLDADAGG